MSHNDGLIIAIDGPAGSGKSSTARAVAAILGYRHLDSGAFYRGLTLAAQRAEIDPERWSSLTTEQIDALGVGSEAGTRSYGITLRGEDVSAAIRSPEVTAHVSRMAAVPTVRAWLLDALRHAGETGGLVADGRDIGTVVFPDAELKLFLVCAPEERARRRLLQEGREQPSNEEIRAETVRLTARDASDSSREIAPLIQAPDAVLLDTTELDFTSQVDAIVHLARERTSA